MSGKSQKIRRRATAAADNKEPGQADSDALIALYQQSKFNEGELFAVALAANFPKSGFVWKVLGAIQQSQGRSDAALASMLRAADLAPNDEQLQSNLGVVLAGLGRLDEAVKRHRQALKIKPDFAQAHFNLGVVLQAQNLLSAAEACYAYALQLEPSLDHARTALANVLKELNRYSEAALEYRKILQRHANAPDAHNNLGIVLKRQGQIEAADACYRRAVELNPLFAEAHYNLGISLAERGHTEEAMQSYCRAIAIKTDYPAAYNNLGNLLETERRFAEAEAQYRHAVSIDERYAEAHCNLGNALRGQGKLPEAEASYRRALQIQPQLPQALYNLGIALAEQCRLFEAEESYRHALRVKPDYAEAQKNLGNVLKEQGRFAEAETCYRQALLIRPDYVDAQSNLLFDLNYSATRAAAVCRHEAVCYGQMVQRVATRFAAWQCDPNPVRLRIGLVSGDFHSHPVGYFLESMLAQLDPARIELYAYSAHHETDQLTARIRPHFAKWQPIVGQTDAAAARGIHADGVHVLLDLSGHTARNRLPLFAFKPAPVQASWLGYFATTGVAEMDYLLGDPCVTPVSEADHFIEKIWRLPDSYLCFTPPGVLDVGPLPASSANGVTFGCFNNLVKMTDAVVALWSRVLQAVPGSRLMLKCRQLNDAATCKTTVERFAAHGIDPRRLVLEGSAPRIELLAAYRRVDIALDPFPYPGGTTSAEGLWMGVPVIVRRGDRFLSHVGESIAHNAGMTRWIAADDDDYIAKAVAAAADLQALAALRAALRPQVLASPLFDAARFARHFATALWGMWQRWQSQQGQS